MLVIPSFRRQRQIQLGLLANPHLKITQKQKQTTAKITSGFQLQYIKKMIKEKIQPGEVSATRDASTLESGG